MAFISIAEQWYPQVAKIYKAGMDTGIATFETTVPDWEIWNQKHLPFSRIGLVNDISKQSLLAWAALSAVSRRAVYSGVAEVSLYVDKSSKSQGYGFKLLQALIDSSEDNGLWTLQASIFKENEASIHLHKKSGFRVIGYREKVAQRLGVWHDNVLMERRSNTINNLNGIK